MIDCALVYLPKPFLKNPDAQAPLGIMYIAASLLERGKTVELKQYASYSDDDAIMDLPEAALYGITATSLEIPHANRFSRKIKLKYPDAHIVIGGPGVYARDFIDFSVVDSICYGDGEHIIHDILADAKNNSMPRIYYGGAIEDLDSLPLPARHLLKDHQGGDIFAYNKRYAEGDSTILVSSRGCPMVCAFCSAPALTYNKKLRFRDPQKIAEEIRFVKENYGIKQFRFSDDFFTANRERVLALCDAIGPEDVFWRISCRVKPLDDEMLRAMYAAGCRELSFGIESFDDDVLTGLKKNATVNDNVRALNLASKYDFSIRILLMIRTPFQTFHTVDKNIYWLLRVPFNIVACTTFVPLPGSDIWENPDEYNIEILDKDLDKYNFYFFGPDGRRPMDKIFRIKNRDIEEFHKESELFRDWLENDLKRINRG